MTRQMRDYEASLRSEYEEKLEYLERKVKSIEAHGRRDLKGEYQAANEELLRRDFEEQLAEERHKVRGAEQEIEKLEHQLAVKTEETAALRLTIEALQQKSGQDEAQIRSLNDSLFKVSHELAAVRVTSHSESIKRGSKTASTTEESPAKSPFASGSPLHRRFDESEGAESLRKYYEQKCLELSEEALQWREKTRLLASRHHQALQTLQRQHKQLRAEVESLQEDTRAQLRDLTTRLPPKEGRLLRRQPQSVERLQRPGNAQRRAEDS